MCTYIFIPPLGKTSGGLSVLYRIADILNASGHNVFLVPREKTNIIPESSIHHVCPWENIQNRLSPNDIWLVPEGWPMALAPGLNTGARTIVYVQNWSFLFSALPEGMQLGNLPLEFLAVSDPVGWFIKNVTGKTAKILRPGIDTSMFFPELSENGDLDKPAPRGNIPIRIAYMPRKNKASYQQTKQILEARNFMTQQTEATVSGRCKSNVEWVEIHGKSPGEVAEIMRSCHIFMATGFPEGFSLPPLEAMACACIVVGFSGFGGMDYMRPHSLSMMCGAKSLELPLPFELPDVPWYSNSLVVPDGDVVSLAQALERACKLVSEQGEDYFMLVRQSLLTAKYFSYEIQEQAVIELWQELEKGKSV